MGISNIAYMGRYAKTVDHSVKVNDRTINKKLIYVTISPKLLPVIVEMSAKQYANIVEENGEELRPGCFMFVTGTLSSIPYYNEKKNQHHPYAKTIGDTFANAGSLNVITYPQVVLQPPGSISSNVVTVVGRLGNDPQIKFLESGAMVVEISVAVDSIFKGDDGKYITSWFRVSFWDKKGSFIGDHFGKGDLIAIDGTLDIRSYEKEVFNEDTEEMEKVTKFATQIKGKNASFVVPKIERQSNKNTMVTEVPVQDNRDGEDWDEIPF